MRPRNLFLASLIALLLILIFTAGSLIAYNATRMLPEQDGIAYLRGLREPVTIVRDELGIPHIYASTAEDLFFAQGYVHAQDRWWQMEFQRHTGLGRIQELTGFNAGALGSDLLIRTWGWNRAAAADEAFIAPETRTILEAYAAGVNAYTAGKPGGALALEYTLLGLTGVQIEVEPWTPLDTAAFAKTMAWYLGGNADSEMERMDMLERLGPELTGAYFPPYPYDERPTIVTAADLPLTAGSLSAAASPSAAGDTSTAAPYRDVATSMAGGAEALAYLPPRDAGIGSNNWVIAGSNTASGLPILANDPHLNIQMPSIWYEIGLHCRPVSDACPYDVVGFSFVGAPAVIAGHNQRIAWGVTNLNPDVQDLYIIRVNPEDPYQYEYNGEWRDMEVVTETIRIGGTYEPREDDPTTEDCEGVRDLPLTADGALEITVRVTHFGPIITDNTITDDCRFVGLTEDGDPLAVRWTGLEPGDLLRAALAIDRAIDWQSFRQALAYWDWPSQNFVYADVDGNIGYQAPGKIPFRAADHSGLVPVPGWTDAYEWRGTLPFDLLPRVLNPERGWIVTANHAAVPAEYYDQLAAALGPDANYTISQDWDEGYRSQRIVEMVSGTSAHTVETMAEIQGDNHNLVAEELMPYLLALDAADESVAGKSVAEAITWLAGWDLQAGVNSPQAALFEMLWLKLSEALWADQLDAPDDHAWAVRLLLDQPDHPWWDDLSTPAVKETRDDILLRALAQALEAMTAEWGADREAWRWGNLHTATFVNVPLGQSGIDPIEGLFNAGPLAVSGTSRAVNSTAWSLSDPFAVRSLPSFRMIVDLANLENSRVVHTTGQSGHPLSPHYRDMIDAWRTIDYHPLRFGDEAVSAAATHTLELRPAPPAGGASAED